MFNRLLVASFIAVSSISFSAQADVFNVGTITPQTQTPVINEFDFEEGSFIADNYQFTLNSSAIFTSNVVFSGISNIGLSLSSSSGPLSLSIFTNAVGPLTSSSITSILLGAGKYTFGIGGFTTSGAYIGSFTIGNPPAVAAVPEPETYAMFLAGLGLLGFASSRKKSS
jgi:hypothetical protein